MLSESDFKYTLVMRRAYIRKKHLDGGITEEQQERLDELTKQLYGHYREVDGEPRGYTIPEVFSRTCTICGHVSQNRDEGHQHFDVCPNRKLDNDIAEKVLGWNLEEDQLGNRYWARGDQRHGFSEHTCSDSFEPAKNMEHTKFVMDEIRKKWGFEVTIRTMGWISPETPYYVDIEIPIIKKDFPNRPRGVKIVVEDRGANLEELVCRAILLAIERREKHDTLNADEEWALQPGARSEGIPG
jgi:hypothetical protein